MRKTYRSNRKRLLMNAPNTEAALAANLKVRDLWVERVTELVAQVEQWVRDLGWSTRRVEKTLHDVRIGKHQVPGLLMQQEFDRVLLEPIAHSTPGSDGIVDLYLLPAYDDIATLLYYDNEWHVHYNTYRKTNAVVPEAKETAEPLSQKTLAKVLAEMRQNAA